MRIETSGTFETVSASLSVLLPAVVCYLLLRRTQKKYQTGDTETSSLIASWTCLIFALIGTGAMLFRLTEPPSTEDEAFKFIGMLYFYSGFSCIALPIVYISTRSVSGFVSWSVRKE